MPKKDEDKVTILLSEYEFLHKSFELQFNHFMGVFYFWIAVITAPISASLISNLGAQDSVKPLIYGILCFLVAFIGLFLSIKMFDIRRSQLRYAQKLNELRAYFWQTYIKEEKLIPLGMENGKWVDVFQKARTDFGQKMALTMSLVHGILVLVGLSQLIVYFLSLNGLPIQLIYFIGIFIGIMVFVLNYRWYFAFFPEKNEISTSNS